MLRWIGLLCVSLAPLAQLDGNQSEPDFDLADFDLDIAPQRVTRQVKAILTKETKPHIQELSIKTTIMSRYAFTAVYCAMLNRHSAATKGAFQFQIPADAYVSNFTIAGAESEAELFRMEVNIPGRNRAVFLLCYEELLQRRLGRYQHVTSLRPLQLVSRLSLEVTVVDRSPITELQVLPLRNGRSNAGRSSSTATAKLPVTTVIKKEKNICRITFSPNIVQQAQISTSGVLGDFIVRYDVHRDMGIGDIQVLNGHFVHYFAPKDLPVVPKNVVFVIDTSASMVGTKMKQTQEALFTILKSLRPEDHFNFISFSNKIRVWRPDGLVAAAADNVSDAKRFILMLTTTGGTNIDGAVHTGALLLREHLSRPDANPNSVSLVIFLTDGHPTVGQKLPAVILENTRSAVSDNFCIFTIAMGHDVDYRLLERMALDNCGMMRRIPQDAKASAMLKGFYDEIGTPLLSDIRIQYTEESVEYVTQHLFTNYFNGSEIIIAGKLKNASAESLHVQVTASNNDKSIVLETDVPLKHRQIETEKHVKAATGAMTAGTPASAAAQGVAAALGVAAGDFVERLWGFLSVKEGLRSRLRSQTSKEREGHVQQTSDLSMRYHFLTPLTKLEVETPMVLEDGSMAPPPPSGTPGVKGGANELPADDDESLRKLTEKPARLWSQVGKVERRPVKKSISVSRTSADGDPHFVVEFPLSKLTVCFNINGEPGHVLRLVSDHEGSGVTVNGKLIGAPAPTGSHKQQRTYFSTVTIVAARPQRAYIEVTPRRVILDGRDRIVLPCSSTVAVQSGQLSVAIVGRSNVTVTVGGDVVFVIVLHQYKNPAAYQRDHLGFYIGNSKGLSSSCHGLIGQFLYEDVGLEALPAGGEPNASSLLKVKDRRVPVVKKSRKILSGTQNVDCWFARNNAAKLIDGQYGDYVASHMFDTGETNRV